MSYEPIFKNAIVVENISFCLSNDEKKKLEDTLNENHIDLFFYEQRSIQNSFFETLSIYFNKHLTELIVAGILVPATYEAIKFAVFKIVKGVNKFIRNAEKNKPITSLRLKTEKIEIIAPIPNNLNDKQFSDYMDMLQKTLIELGANQTQNIERYECFIIEYIDEQSNLKVKTMLQYAVERTTEQKK